MPFSSKRHIVLSGILVFCHFYSARAQIVGNPIEVRGAREWTVGLHVNYARQDIDSLLTTSKRLLVRSTWGLTPHLDFYLTAGAVQLDISTGEPQFSDYAGAAAFAYGAGFNFALQRISTERPVGVWLGGHILRFPSNGSFIESLTSTESGIYREFEMTYDWLEIQGSLGLIVPVGRFHFYASFVTVSITRRDTKAEYLIAGDSKTLNGEDRAKYRSGLMNAALAGIELTLPGRHAVTVELMYRNKKDYRVMAGICQTGIGAP